MRGKNTIIINGRAYDATTGLPHKEVNPSMKTSPQRPVMDISAPRRPNSSQLNTPHQQSTTATRQGSSLPNHIKKQPQKSATLHRSALKKPAGTHEQHSVRTKPHQTGHVARSTMISKFASHPQPLATKPAHRTNHTSAVVRNQSATPTNHPVIRSQMSAQTQPPLKQHTAEASRALKEKLIENQLANATPNTKDHAPKKRLFAAHPRTSSVIAGCLSLMVLGGYLTYLNMPNLSVRVAAAQAGVDASFPEYRPDGYRFNGPIAYAPGEVSMRFAANGGPQHYVVTQKNSQWDSRAVLENYVGKSTDSYLTYSEQGMTVYTYKNQAAWVNGGIFYTIEGDAPLTSEQVLRIAASL